jgi:hypothetical protein
MAALLIGFIVLCALQAMVRGRGFLLLVALAVIACAGFYMLGDRLETAAKAASNPVVAGPGHESSNRGKGSPKVAYERTRRISRGHAAGLRGGDEGTMPDPPRNF